MNYIAYLHKDAHSDYGVSFPDFPGCVTAASSLEQAREMAAEALAFHIKGMREAGEAIPKPSSLDDLRDDPAMEGAVAFLVSPREPERVVRINISVPEGQLAEIDHRAATARLTRSAFLVRQALASPAKRGGSRSDPARKRRGIGLAPSQTSRRTRRKSA